MFLLSRGEHDILYNEGCLFVHAVGSVTPGFPVLCDVPSPFGSPVNDFESVFEDVLIPTDVNVIPFVTYPPLHRSTSTAKPTLLSAGDVSNSSEDEREFARSE